MQPIIKALVLILLIALVIAVGLVVAIQFRGGSDAIQMANVQKVVEELTPRFGDAAGVSDDPVMYEGALAGKSEDEIEEMALNEEASEEQQTGDLSIEDED